VHGGYLLIYTNAPESCGRPLAIFKSSQSKLAKIREEYNSPYVEIRWYNWKLGVIPKIQDTFVIQ
jgi:hypothetical protein